MTEDNESTDTQKPADAPEGEEAKPSSSMDDQRFEVKWKKKATTTSKPVEAPEPETQDVAAMKRELEEAQQRVRDLQDRWQRSAADLVNLRRRTEQERGEMEKFASMLLVSELLPALDNFERALATIPGNLVMLTWIQGVMLIERHVRAILEHQGLAEIDAAGQPFDPHVHEAVSERETAEKAPGTVVQVYQKGYTMHGRVIRPALVEVAREPSPQPEATADSTSVETETPVTDDGPEIANEVATENTGS
jgi:molecular chaperone GrpE